MIDAAAKRLSALDYEEVWAEAIPIPDGTNTASDRYHGLWSYCGFVYSIKGGVSVGDALYGGVSVGDALYGGVSVGENETVFERVGMALEDGSGMWLFEDGTVICWGSVAVGSPSLSIGDS